MGEIKLVPRNEVDKKYTWDMTLLYKSDKEFISSLENIKKSIIEFKKNYEGKLADFNVLDKAVKEYEAMYEEFYKLSHYAELPMTVDRFNENVVNNATLFEEVSTLWASNLSFFDNRISRIGRKFY